MAGPPGDAPEDTGQSVMYQAVEVGKLALCGRHNQPYDDLRHLEGGATTASSAGEAASAGMGATQHQHKAQQDAAASMGPGSSTFAGQLDGALLSLQAVAARSAVHFSRKMSQAAVDAAQRQVLLNLGLQAALQGQELQGVMVKILGALAGTDVSQEVEGALESQRQLRQRLAAHQLSLEQRRMQREQEAEADEEQFERELGMLDDLAAAPCQGRDDGWRPGGGGEA
ncbi:hypothetical protein N2152v2_005108 [Parachlorella kessleri]